MDFFWELLVKVFFSVLLALSGVLGSFFVGQTGVGVWKYCHWNGESKVAIAQWKIEEKGEDAFAVRVFYRFYVSEKEFFGETELAKPYFFNRLSAEKAVANLSLQEWIVFFAKIHPEDNTLQRRFPFLSLIHAVLALGVLVYFSFLRIWASKLVV